MHNLSLLFSCYQFSVVHSSQSHQTSCGFSAKVLLVMWNIRQYVLGTVAFTLLVISGIDSTVMSPPF